jgi:hypothetical protein
MTALGQSRRFWHARSMSANRLVSEMLALPLIAPSLQHRSSQRPQIIRHVADVAQSHPLCCKRSAVIYWRSIFAAANQIGAGLTSNRTRSASW